VGCGFKGGPEGLQGEPPDRAVAGFPGGTQRACTSTHSMTAAAGQAVFRVALSFRDGPAADSCLLGSLPESHLGRGGRHAGSPKNERSPRSGGPNSDPPPMEDPSSLKAES
jgi:hypothetical protein